MSRYIDADKLILYSPLAIPSWMLMYINNTPTADVRENVKAKKVIGGGERDGATCWFECSHCHGTIDLQDMFCKHCGADMRGDNHD